MPSPDPKGLDEIDPRDLRRLTRRGFAWAAGAVAAAVGGLAWLNTRSAVDGLPWPLRAVLRANERLWGSLPGRARLAREFPPSSAREPRPNGDIGLDGAVEPASWRLRVVGPAGEARMLTMDDLRHLARVGSTNELKCIEGWSEVVSWSGFRLADLAAMTGLATRSGRPFDPVARPGDILPYVALETPDAAYYVGLDSDAAFHPQTLLCDAMNGAPLTPEHGPRSGWRSRSSTGSRTSSGSARSASPPTARATTGRSRATTGTPGSDRSPRTNVPGERR